ncbi:hypothetical protein [Hominenteromicrobium sp.]|uniref:hypothetical protein n=1 Tax=Hominenteromicrobium sp. TaxID=3073581 RepID=UPI003AB49224
MRAKCELGKLQDSILRIFGTEGKRANRNEVFRLFEDNFKKLQNCNFVRRYGVQLENYLIKK